MFSGFSSFAIQQSVSRMSHNYNCNIGIFDL